MANVKSFYDPRTHTLTYVVWDEATRDAVAVDPVLDYDPAPARTFTESVDAVSDFVRANHLKLHFTLETHAHADHVSGSQILRRRFGARIVIGRHITVVQETFREIFDLGPTFAADGRQFDVLMTPDHPLVAGGLEVRAIDTPGHTPACVTYQIDDAIFTGDALFIEDYGTGRCDFPKGSAEALYDSVQKLYALPDETRVFVGHDYQPGGRDLRWETSIAASKAHNSQLNATTTKDAFVQLRRARDKNLPAPRLILPSVQLNVNAGRLPDPHPNGRRYLHVPLNLFSPADELGEPTR